MIERKPVYEFNSIFAPYIRDYLELKETVGEKTVLPGNSLRQFDRYCCSINVGCISLTEKIVNDYLAVKKDEKAQTLSTRISILHCFSKYLSSVGVNVSWTPTPGYTGRSAKYVPYIFSKTEIDNLTASADAMAPSYGKSMFHLVFPAVLRVLYACGLRVSECLHLKVKDVDLIDGFLFIKSAKFGKDRKLPISESLLIYLRKYYTANAELIGIEEENWFFPNPKGECYSQRTVYDKFRAILWQAGISHQGKGKGPRVHDFRHTFAVRALAQIVEKDKDIYTSLTGLMVYLGHSKISSTEYYLRLTAEVFPDFLKRADGVSAYAIPEVVSYEE
jgi:site-specific recombinase XerD